VHSYLGAFDGPAATFAKPAKQRQSSPALARRQGSRHTNPVSAQACEPHLKAIPQDQQLLTCGLKDRHLHLSSGRGAPSDGARRGRAACSTRPVAFSGTTGKPAECRWTVAPIKQKSWRHQEPAYVDLPSARAADAPDLDDPRAGDANVGFERSGTSAPSTTRPPRTTKVRASVMLCLPHNKSQ
jgi:hypothetical protein